MHERERFNLATMAAEAMYQLWVFECRQREPEPDAMMRRFKDLSAYSLTHAEIMDQREGVELLALAMFFGATSNPGFHQNQKRLALLSEGSIAYPGRAEIVEQQVAQRKAKVSQQGKDTSVRSAQPRLF